MSYREIALAVRDWTAAHGPRLSTCCAGGELLCAELSSPDGQSFRIAIDRPVNGIAGVHLVCVEGWKQNDPHQNWVAEVADVREALDEALAEVRRQMEMPFSLPEEWQIVDNPDLWA
jgi:hypothetical protein